MNTSIVLLALIVIGIVLGSLLPIQLGDYDKILHVGAYGSLMFYLCCVFPKYKREWFLLVLFASVGMEILQSYELLGRREFSYKDIAANVTGVYAALFCLLVKDRLYDRRRQTVRGM